MLVGITGGTGFIGRRLVASLVEQGARVRVLTRRVERVRRLLPRRLVEPWVGDLIRPETLRGFARDTEVVYHLAGENRDAGRFNIVNVTGTQNLLAVCHDQNLRKFVHLSSTGVIGASGTGLVDESAPCHPRNAYERSKYAGEQMALAAFERYQIPVTVIRPPNVFGEGRIQNGDIWLAWITAIQKGRFRFFGTGDSVANYIYVEDVVSACLLVAGSGKASGEVYIVSDPCSLRSFVGAAAEFLNVSTPGNLPIWLGYAAAIVFEGAGRLGHFSPPLTVSRVRALTNKLLYSSAKLREELGFRPPVGWREGLHRTLEWYKQNGLLSDTGSP